MTLYNSVYNLFHQWLSTTNEDSAKFKIWLKSRILYISDRVHIPIISYQNHADVSLLDNPQNAIITSNGEYIQITTNTNGEKKVNVPFGLTTTTNAFMEWTYVSGGTNQPITFLISNSSNSAVGGWFSYDGSSFYFSIGSQVSNLTRTVNNGDKMMVVRYNGVTEVYHNNVLITSATKSFTGSVKFGFYTNNARVQRLKDIKVGTL